MSVIEYISDLVDKYKYRPLPQKLSDDSRMYYYSKLPKWAKVNGNKSIKLYSKDGTLICTGYKRIVVGDYGAFIEFTRDQIEKDNICCKKGEEYRFRDPKFAQSVKYFWYTTKDRSNPKIYFQQKTVLYADYKPKMFYVSPYDVEPKE